MNESLGRFIERIERLRLERQAEPTEQDFDEIAREIGLSEADLAGARAEVDEGLTRARGYLDHALWDDALRELRAVADLAPVRVELHHAIALALAGRFRATAETDDRRAATAAARRCLELDPSHRPSFALLRDLDRSGPRSPWLAPLAAASTLGGTAAAGAWSLFAGTPALIPALGASALLAAVAGLLVRSTGRRAQNQGDTGAPAHAPATTTTVRSSAGDRGRPRAVEGRPGRPPPEQDFPIEHTLDAETVSLWVRKSRLERYPDRAFHEVVLELENVDSLQLDELELRFEYFDADGKSVHSDTRHALSPTHDAPLRPGDSHVVDVREMFEPPLPVAKLVLTEGATRRVAAEDAAVPRPLALEWHAERPPGVDLALRQRSPSGDTLDADCYTEVIWEIESVGTSAVYDLAFHFELVDDTGKVVDSQHCMLTYEDRVLYPGEVRLEKWLVCPKSSGCSIRAVVRE